MSPSTPAARRARPDIPRPRPDIPRRSARPDIPRRSARPDIPRRSARPDIPRRSAGPGALRIAAGGLALAGGALLASAVPALAAPAESDETATSQPSSDPAAIDGETPTPAPKGPEDGSEPETVLLGVPIEGTLKSVERATNILPGSGPGDYA